MERNVDKMDVGGYVGFVLKAISAQMTGSAQSNLMGAQNLWHQVVVDVYVKSVYVQWILIAVKLHGIPFVYQSVPNIVVVNVVVFLTVSGKIAEMMDAGGLAGHVPWVTNALTINVFPSRARTVWIYCPVS